MKKIYIYILVVIFSMNTIVYANAQKADKSFSVTELKKYDGKNNYPAYIAVDGVVYDVTKISHWKNGTHSGYSAGNDLSIPIKKYPSMREKLKTVPIVGKLNK